MFEVSAPDIAAKAKVGQFIIIVPHERGERIPLTICDYDSKKGTVSLLSMRLVKPRRNLACFPKAIVY